MPAESTRRTLAAALAVLLSAAACSEPPAAAEQPPPLPVRTESVRSVDASGRLQAGGVVSAGAHATLSSRIVAPITAVRVRAGDRVRAGQVLVVLESGDLSAQLHQATAAASSSEHTLDAARSHLQEAQAELSLATSWHRRISALHARESATQQELDEAQARLSAATARTEGASARIEQARSAARGSSAGMDAASAIRAHASIVAPFDGLVTERLVDPGSLAAPGVPLIRIDAEGPSKVVATMDESRAGYLAVGAPVAVTLGREQDDQPRRVEGTITQMGRQVDAGARAFAVEVSLPAGTRAPSGSFARLTFAGSRRTALVVPADAIVRRGQVTAVFVAADGVARLRLVHLGEALEDGVEVLAGLDAGERIVVAPPPSLSDGRRISVAAAAGVEPS